MKTIKLSRAETNRRLQSLTVDPWGHLSGTIEGARVNAWSTGRNRRIERVSVYGIPKTTNAAQVFRVAKRVKAVTGLTVHFNFGMLHKVL